MELINLWLIVSISLRFLSLVRKKFCCTYILLFVVQLNVGVKFYTSQNCFNKFEISLTLVSYNRFSKVIQFPFTHFYKLHMCHFYRKFAYQYVCVFVMRHVLYQALYINDPIGISEGKKSTKISEIMRQKTNLYQ